MRSPLSDIRTVAALIAFLMLCAGPLRAQPGVWHAEGPAPQTKGQVEAIGGQEVVGAVHAIAPHPTDPNTLFIGSVNGGVWRTGDALATSPTWVPQTDQQTSQSIGALEFDPTDASNQTLVAGIGRFSNIGGVAGGSLSGLLRTTDGGANWAPLGTVQLSGANVSGVAARGSVIVVADTNAGIWRSTDTGLNWTQISGLAGSGLPTGGAFDLAGVPGTPARLFTNAGSNGVYLSTDTGATWTPVNNAAMNALSPYGNVQISATSGNVVYVAFAAGGTVSGIFRSGDGGNNWTAMDIPTVNEAGGASFGLHPGGQAGINLSLLADPTNANLVYVGGDRQPGPADGAGFPNAIGAKNFTGRLFRGNAGAAAGSQFVHLTHSNSQGPSGGGTINGSAPHADSRDMAFDASGNLLEVDDGGVYRRTLPQSNAGAWFSVNGSLQNTEFHSIAWDAVSNRIIGGAQDVGTPEQLETGEREWEGVTQGDGGAVAIDDISAPGQSTRFFSGQNLRYQGNLGLGTRVYDSQATLVAETPAPLTVLAGGAAINPQFYTPVAVNNVDGTRLIIGAQNAVYESLDAGQTVTLISAGVVVNSSLLGESIAYGAADNVDMLYVGSGARVFVRNGPDPGSVLTVSAAYPGTAAVVDVALDPNDSLTAYAIDSNRVYQTRDGGTTWTNVTGDLSTFNPGNLRSVEVVAVAEQHAVAVGTDRGVFWADRLPVQAWSQPCTGMPVVPVTDLEFDVADEVLAAGTLGRGAWTCAPARPRPRRYQVKFFCGTGDDVVLAPGRYLTAINIINRDDATAPPSRYWRSFTIGLPGETVGGQTTGRAGANLAPGEAVEIDCDDILRETGRACGRGLCKGFALIESPAPLDIVPVYTSADPAAGQVTGLHMDPLATTEACPTVSITIPAQTRLLVPQHRQGDREFDGHGPCVRLAVDLRIEDDGATLTAAYEMHAFECAGSFSSPQSDFTAAIGSGEVVLATAGPGGRILGTSTSRSLLHTYIDTDHADDVFNFTGDEPVSELRFVGDTDGDESGTKTRVSVTFRAMQIRMQSCAIPSKAG